MLKLLIFRFHLTIDVTIDDKIHYQTFEIPLFCYQIQQKT